MTFPVPAPNTIVLDSVARQVGQIARARGSEQVRPVLAVGTVLEVTVAKDNNNQLGIELAGKFYPAVLPPNVAVGDKLRVAVQSNLDQLVLKLLADPSQVLENEIPHGWTSGSEAPFLDEVLIKLLPEQSLDSLKKAMSGTQLAPLIASTANPLDRLFSPQNGQVQDQVGRLFQNLFARHVLVEENSLGDSQTLERVLKNLSQSSIVRAVQDAARSVEQLAKGAPSPSLVRFSEAVVQQLDTILSEPEALSFAPMPGKTTAVPAPATLTFALSQYALATGNTALLNTLAQQATTPETTTVDLLLRTLTQLKTATNSAESALSGSLGTALEQLRKTLEHARTSSHESELRGALQNARQQIKATISGLVAKNEGTEEAQRGAGFLRGLESMLSSQEVLNQVNPVVQTLGQPGLMLIPALAQGMLSKWTMTVEQPPVDPDEDRNSAGNREQYERVKLDLSLPTLGKIGIDLAHRKEELLLAVTVEDPALEKFISQQFPLLETALTAVGITKFQAQAKHGVPNDPTPQWYRKVTAREVIA